jgi:dipeptidyl aminopeptidase/acylaminoacyl peptidase
VSGDPQVLPTAIKELPMIRKCTLAAAALLGHASATLTVGPTSAAAGPAGVIASIWANGAFINEEIGVVTTDGRDQGRLTNEAGFDVSPAWSPDGRRIAFTGSRSMPLGFQGESRLYSELYVMNADGSDVQRITNNVGLIDFQPAWSPDGERIVVARGPGTSSPRATSSSRPICGSSTWQLGASNN